MADDDKRVGVFLARFVGGPAEGTDVPLPLLYGSRPPESICSDGDLETQHWHYVRNEVNEHRYDFTGPCTEDNEPHSWHEHPEPHIRVHRIQIAHGSLQVSWWQRTLFFAGRLGLGIVLALLIIKTPTPVSVGLVFGLFVFIGFFTYRATRFNNSVRKQTCLFCGRGEQQGTPVMPVPAIGERAESKRLKWWNLLPPRAFKVVWVCRDDVETYLAARRSNPAPEL